MIERRKSEGIPYSWAFLGGLQAAVTHGGFTFLCTQAQVSPFVGKEDSIFCVKGAANVNCLFRAESLRVIFF